MSTDIEPEIPKPKLATEDFVLRINMDTERRIEKAFHEQTVYLDNKFQTHNRWMIGLMVTLIIAIIATLSTLAFS